jgi:pilus assembly protein CpaE
MGRFEPHYFDEKDAGVRMYENVLIVASPVYVNDIDPSRDAATFPGLQLMACQDSDWISLDVLRSSSLVVLEINPASRESMERFAEIKRNCPELPVVAAIAGSSMELVRALVREGVADVVSLPFAIPELLETTVAVLSQAEAAPAIDPDLAPVFAVVQSIGGCGATSVATHVAAELGLAAKGRGVAIIDLDLQFGTVADYMTAEGRGSIMDLISADHRLDAELMRSTARQAINNVSVFAAPDTIQPLESIDAEQLLIVIQLIRQHYDHVVIDLPANWTNWTLSVLNAADAALMVTELSVASLRQAKRRLALFDTVGIAPSRVSIVVNRVQRRLFKTIGVGDVADTLGRDVLGSLSLEDPLLGSAQDQGVLVQQIQRKSRFHADIRAISEHLLASHPGGPR